MNKLSKIFLVISSILAIALGLMTYYCFYWRDAYFSAANEVLKNNEWLESIGVNIMTTVEDNDNVKAIITVKDDDNVTTTIENNEINITIDNVEQIH
jgi:hypothetical protein